MVMTSRHRTTSLVPCFTVASRHAPVMTKKVRGVDCPWINSEIKRSMRQRDYYLAKARQTNDDEDWCLYRSQRNCVTNLIRVYKSRYSRKLIEENNNPTAFYLGSKRTCYQQTSR